MLLIAEVGTTDSAKSAAHQGTYAAALCAGITAIAALIAWGDDDSVVELNAWVVVDIAAFAAVAVASWQVSRVAALTGLLLFVAERTYAMAEHGFQSNGTLVALIVLFGFINGVRGAFAYRRYRARDAEPSAPRPVLA